MFQDTAFDDWWRTRQQSLNNSSNWANNISAGADVFKGVAGLANAYTGWKNYELAKKQFNAEKAFANRNLANNAKLINQQLGAQANAASYTGLAGGMSQAQAGQHMNTVMGNVERHKVDGTPI
jgi:hypothetical protein